MSQNQQDGTAAQRASSKPGDEKSRISVIEKSVTHLLVATKALLETLTRWSKLTATESEVSDVYVRLGYEFNIACRAFNSIGVETQDLGPVPDLLRNILEETLSGEPSQAHLDIYLPRIRDIIVNLLQGLKKKQQRLRQRQSREQSQDLRQNSTGDISSSFSQDSHSRQSSRSVPQRQDSIDMPNFQNEASQPPRSSSASANDRATQSRYGTDKHIVQGQTNEEPKFAFAIQPASSSPPYPQEDNIPPQYPVEPVNPASTSEPSLSMAQPRHGDALAALQRGGDLERRASRRFSAFHIQKHLGPSTGIPMIPPAQNSPIPNRGRDMRESMNAVRVRGPQTQSRGSSRKGTYESPSRQSTRQDKVPEDSIAVATSGPFFEMPAEIPAVGSPYAATPNDKMRPSYVELEDTPPQKADSVVQPTITLTDGSVRAMSPPAADDANLERSKYGVEVPVRRSSRKQNEPISATQSDRPTSNKDLTLFLQYKTKIKKFVLPDGYEELSIARLQLAFIEKFAWNTQSNGVELPEIYIQDPVSGVRHELEDLTDVKNHSVLALNVDSVEEVKRHVDDGMGGLKSMMQDVRSAITEQQIALQRVSDKQYEANKAISRLATTPSPIQTHQQPVLPNGVATSPSNRGVTPEHLNEVRTLRRDLAVMRQTYSTSLTDIQASISNLRDKATGTKPVAASRTSFPSAAEADGSSSDNGRAYVNSGRKTLNGNSETLMTRVEELQDTVEDLRKDVVTRGVRPLPRQLDTVSKEISTATIELKKLQEFIKREKPTWTKIWKDELQVVCDDQNLLTYQEELCADLEVDLEAAAQTFGLVEEATKQQNLVNASAPQVTTDKTGSTRSSSRTLNPAADPAKAKDGVLGEVRALQPNHESRIEAITRAEKLRQRELESRKDGEFQKELGGFVDEGKLKKSGGFEEVERIRKYKDEMTRKEVWERTNGGRGVGGPSPSGSPAPDAQLDAKAAESAIAGAAMPQPLELSGGADPGTPDPRFEDAPEAPFPP